ncbi:E3 ubiquitin-protein ligase RNF181-like isoform X2 [Eriocheir sinensis]|uniref:E3 ubiquitin-protein ligase RNF181-like isoform X2 n=1 Tax=Eriocheir sinensis TaxID=95602 RepID=UPI0021CAC975|nr:E3 ubiquitin-protein ligase RNF181-like isoform X2 [Eriocheir sinensis]
MTSYFDEHNCQPVAPAEPRNDFLHIARLLRQAGYSEMTVEGIVVEISQIFGSDESPPPPASKEFVKDLPTVTMEKKGSQCAVCLKEWEAEEEGKRLPCSHIFHPPCILPWLAHTNSCPLCRLEMPTDDPDYEEYRKEKKRAKEREAELEILHHSMFS